MAALLRKELDVPVEELGGRYGEFTVLVDGEVAMSGGAAVWLGIMPPAEDVLRVVRTRLSA